MPKQIIIAEQHHIAAVFSEDQIQELVVATGNQQVGDIFLGTVENVIPGIDAAFVNIGDAEKNGFIHVSDLGPLRLKKSAGSITELLAPQQSVLVQVIKEPTGNKGPRLTGNISFPGRYVVLIPYGKGVNLSRRIKNENERSRLRALAILIKPAGMGLLVRTEAEGKGEDAIMEDLEFLQQQWEKIQQEASSIRPPALLNRDDDFIQRVLRDMYTSEVNRIVVDDLQGVRRVKDHLINWSGGRIPEGILIDEHKQYQPILEFFRVNAAIKEALKPRVDLPSGGYIIIEPTEALTVIDVNSGSFTRSATSRETVLWTNCEAATEIARQLRLRNIGGVIIIDFIDMDSRRDQLKLLEHFNKILKPDKSSPQIAQLSELGLVELTRKRQGKNLYELFGETCPHCNGLGILAHLFGHHHHVSSRSNLSNSITINPSNKITLPENPLLTDDVNSRNENSSLDLLNHPSYQEQNTNNNSSSSSSRRRPRPTIINVSDNNNSSSNYGLNSETNSKQESKESSILSRSVHRDETKLEKVTVAMTEAEQDVYALMGISPLIRLDKEFNDPKSVFIYIKPPGEGEDNDDLNTKNNHNEELQENNHNEDGFLILNNSEEELETENNLDSHDSNENDNDNDNDRPLIRRRRRRSSAIKA
jgi:ribonuclease E